MFVPHEVVIGVHCFDSQHLKSKIMPIGRGRLKQLWYAYAMEYCLAFTKNERDLYGLLQGERQAML